MDRITIDPAVMGGVACLRGLRIPVATVVNMVAGGMSTGSHDPLPHPQRIATPPRRPRAPTAGARQRSAEQAPEDQATIILDHLDDLESGAGVVVGDDRIRVRLLPLLHDD